MNQEKIGAFIQALRKEKGWTQKQLADQLDVTDKAISKWERGMGLPDVTLLKPLSDALDINVNELLAGEKEQSSHPDVSEVVLDIVTYTDKKRSVDWKRKAVYGISSLSIIAIAVCLLVNYAMSQTLTWSIIPVAGVITGWSILMTLMYAGKKRWYLTILTTGILTIGLLYLIQDVTHSSMWVSKVGLRITLLATGFLLIVTYLYTQTSMNKWLVTVMTVVLAVILNMAIDMILGAWQINIGFYIMLFAAALVILFCLYMSKKK